MDLSAALRLWFVAGLILIAAAALTAMAIAGWLAGRKGERASGARTAHVRPEGARPGRPRQDRTARAGAPLDHMEGPA
jgi:hypothetical protein